MSTFVAVQKRGVIALPLKIRRSLGLDVPGAQLEIVERNGEILLRPHVPIPADQVWFWSPEWQSKEAEVEEHLVAGETEQFASTEDFLDHLDKLDGESDR